MIYMFDCLAWVSIPAKLVWSSSKFGLEKSRRPSVEAASFRFCRSYCCCPGGDKGNGIASVWWGKALRQMRTLKLPLLYYTDKQSKTRKCNGRFRVSVSRKGNRGNNRTSDVYIVTIFSWNSEVSCCGGVIGYWFKFPSVERQEAKQKYCQVFWYSRPW